jgi:predicted metal-dependent phosphoesterase TrpH
LTRARGLGWGLLGVGLALGAWADWIPTTTPPRRDDGRLILAVDFHVHSALGDGAIGPWNLGREARRRGLDAIAITNHNQVFASRLGAWLSRHIGGALIMSGQEITHPSHHLAAVGITRVVDWNLPDTAIVAAVHAQGGIAIAAHPVKPYWPYFSEGALRTIDGTEVTHPIIYQSPERRDELAGFHARAARLRDRPLAAIGSSDFHTVDRLGRCRTYVFARELSQAAILDAVREGQTVAFAEGDPPPAHARPQTPPTVRPGGVATWIGLLVLLLLG